MVVTFNTHTNTDKVDTKRLAHKSAFRSTRMRLVFARITQNADTQATNQVNKQTNKQRQPNDCLTAMVEEKWGRRTVSPMNSGIHVDRVHARGKGTLCTIPVCAIVTIQYALIHCAHSKNPKHLGFDYQTNASSKWQFIE